MIDGSTPVSYTHLDVYKRQLIRKLDRDELLQELVKQYLRD